MKSHRARCCRTASLHMTASVTMQMWHAISSASWRPDPRRGAEPRERSLRQTRGDSETSAMDATRD